MGNVNNNEPERFLTATDVLALFKRLQIEERTRKDEERHGSELLLEISEYLDSTPTYELKEEFTRFKNRSPSTGTTTGTSNIKSTKNLFLNLRSGKQIPTKLSPPSISTQRTLEYRQEQLLYLQGKAQFENSEDKEIFDGTIDQAAKLAIFGFGQAKFQDNDARDYATKALRLPAIQFFLRRTLPHWKPERRQLRLF
jgi:hypothetical protein